MSGILVHLSSLLETIETTLSDLGLDDLTDNERAVLLAMVAAANREVQGDVVCHTEQARKHPLVRRISQPTFHRNLKRLGNRGLIDKVEGLCAGEYRVRHPDSPEAD